MDTASEDLYLQKIEEFVYDEDKIVTFRWLSSTLGISANDAKQLLEKYVTDHRSSKPNNLGVMYLLSGMIEENNLIFAIVAEEELEDKRDSLINVVSQQIYSVQKCKQTDLHAVSLVDYFDIHKPSEVPIIGAVKSKKCIKRVFKTKKPLPPPQQPTIKGKSSFFTKIPPKSNEKPTTNGTEKISSTNKQTLIKAAEPTANYKKINGKEAKSKNKPNGIASFFTKAGSMSEPIPKPESKAETTAKSKSEELVLKSEKVQKKPDTNSILANLVDADSDSEDIISPTQTSQQSKENQKPKRSYKRQKKQNKGSAPSPKRRKRIVERNDSDSDDIFGNDEVDNMHDDVIENSDEDSEPVLKPPPQLAPKNKKRKLVDRTFEDEGGYIVTRKEWVEASGSEEEDQPEEIKSSLPERSEIKSSLPERSEIKSSLPERNEIKEKAKVKDDNKQLKKSESDSPGDSKTKNGKGKAGKGKKAISANQKTLTSFFTRK